VASSDRAVPFRTDLRWWPLDLKCIGWFRSARVGSVSVLLWTVRSRSNGGKQIGSPRVPGVIGDGAGGGAVPRCLSATDLPCSPVMRKWSTRGAVTRRR
jgi:hypothetical protein